MPNVENQPQETTRPAIVRTATRYADVLAVIGFVFAYNIVYTFAFTAPMPFWLRLGTSLQIGASPEIPLLLCLYLLLRFSCGVRWFWLPPFFLILTMYVYFDVFFAFLQKVPSYTDFALLSDLNSVIGPVALSAVLMPVGFSLATLAVAAYTHYRTLRGGRVLRDVALRVACVLTLIALFVTAPGQAANLLDELGNFYTWSAERSVRRNGRLACFVRYDLQRRENLSKIENYAGGTPGFAGRRTYSRGGSVHIVILESFIDPRMIDGVRFSRSPLHEKLDRWIPDGFELVKAPAYGGRSVQAVFELLCGVPAMEAVDSVEFNTFSGSPTYSLASELKASGYRAVMTCGTYPGYYNDSIAYASLQFDEQHFKDESGSPVHSVPGARWLFDGDLFAQTVPELCRKLEKNNRVLNVIVGMYGHLPYYRNLEKRPDVVWAVFKNGDPVEGSLHRIANQFYYRTEALADYIDRILECDPSALIVVVADHLPPILSDQVRYRVDQLQNTTFAIQDGRQVLMNCENYYQIHHWILNQLADRPWPVPHEKEKLIEDYFKIMAAGMQPPSRSPDS